jgi:hypothetical protein
MLMRHMCEYQWTTADVLDGATHVSVDCTADKQMKQEKMKQAEKDPFSAISSIDPFLLQRQHQMRELFTFVVAIVAICLCSCAICLVCSYRYSLQSYLVTLKRRKSSLEMQGMVQTGHGKNDADYDNDATEFEDSEVTIGSSSKQPARNVIA